MTTKRNEQVVLDILRLPTLPAWDKTQWLAWIESQGFDQLATKQIYEIYNHLGHNHWLLRTDYVDALFTCADNAFTALTIQASQKQPKALQRLRQILPLICQLDYMHVGREWMLKVRGWYEIATKPRWAAKLKALTFPTFIEWGKPRLSAVENCLTCPSLAFYAYATLVKYTHYNQRHGLKDIVGDYLVDLIRQMVRLGYHAVIGKCFRLLREYQDDPEGFDLEGYLPLLIPQLTPEELEITRGQALLYGLAIGRLVTYQQPPLTSETLILSPQFVARAQSTVALTNCLICGSSLLNLEGYLRQRIPCEDHMWYQDHLFRCPTCPIAWAEVRTLDDIETGQKRLFAQAYDLPNAGGALLTDRIFLGDQAQIRTPQTV